MNAFFDSSAILRVVLEQPGSIKNLAGYESRVGSQLAEIECFRTLDRMRVMGQISDEDSLYYRGDVIQILDSMELVPTSNPILRRASGTFPVAIGTLDAIHLSTAMFWQDDSGKDLLIVTHDKAFNKAAQALGFKTEGV